jgi:hypothetical protein
MESARHPNSAVILRYLRIALSVGCGVICLLSSGLWVRSYWWADQP